METSASQRSSGRRASGLRHGECSSDVAGLQPVVDTDALRIGIGLLEGYIYMLPSKKVTIGVLEEFRAKTLTIILF